MTDINFRLVPSPDMEASKLTPPDAFTTDDGLMYYTVRIDTDQDHFEKNNHVYQLYPGILVQVFIHIGQRSVLEYLLDPFLVTLGNSLQEQ